MTKKNIPRLQKVQNFAAQIVTGTRKYDHITKRIQEILGIKISLIYQSYFYISNRSAISHTGLLSSERPFQKV